MVSGEPGPRAWEVTVVGGLGGGDREALSLAWAPRAHLGQEWCSCCRLGQLQGLQTCPKVTAGHQGHSW